MNAMMWSKYSSASATVMLILLLLASNGSTNPGVKVNVKVDVDGKELIRASHPKNPETRLDDIIVIPTGVWNDTWYGMTPGMTPSMDDIKPTGTYFNMNIPPEILFLVAAYILTIDHLIIYSYCSATWLYGSRQNDEFHRRW